MLTPENLITISDAIFDDDQPLDSNNYQRITNGRVFIKGISEEKMKKLASDGIQKLGQNFRCYMRLSPKKHRRDKTQPKKFSGNKKTEKKMTYLLTILDEIDLLITRIDTRSENNVVQRSKIERLIRKGETILKKIKKSRERSREKSPLYSKRFSDLYQILVKLRKRLAKRLLNLRNLERSSSRKRKRHSSPMERLTSAERSLRGVIGDIGEEKKKENETNYETFAKNEDEEEVLIKSRVVLEPENNNSPVRKKPKLKPASATKTIPVGIGHRFADQDTSISYKFDPNFRSTQKIIHQFETLDPHQHQDEEEKFELLFNLRQKIKKILKTGKILKDREPLDEILEFQLMQITDKLKQFKSEYLVENSFDKKLKKKVEKYENHLNRARQLLDQSSLFDSGSKAPFLIGVSGLLNKSTEEFLKNLKKARMDLEDDEDIERSDLVSEESEESEPPKTENRTVVLDLDRSFDVHVPQNSYYSAQRPTYVEHDPPSPQGLKQISLMEPSHSEGGDNTLRSNHSDKKGILKKSPSQVEHVVNQTKIINLDQVEGMITALKLVDDEKIAIAFSTGSLCCFEIKNNTVLWSKKEHKGPISSIEITHISFQTVNGLQSKKVILTGGNEEERSILVWDVETSQLLKKLSGHNHLISSIASLEDNSSIATASFDSKIAIWDLSTSFNCIQLLEESSSPILCLDFSKEDQHLCSGSLNGEIYIYKVFYSEDKHLYHGCALLRKFKMDGHIIEASKLASFPNLLLSLQSDFEVKIHSMETGRLLRSFKGPNPFVDFVLVERPDKGPVLFCVDNLNNVLKYENWPVDGGRTVTGRFDDAEFGGVRVKQFFGFSPKTQVLMEGRKLYLIMPDQQKLNLMIQELGI